MKIKWDEWRGSLDGRPTMFIKNYFSHSGFKFDLHKFIKKDDEQCFHTHPAKSFRIVIWGGYIEEMENGDIKTWFPLRCGFVQPSLSHRISGLIKGASYSLWFRWPKTDEIKLRGNGWEIKSGEDNK